jgi:valyl-tRNA synthetase
MLAATFNSFGQIIEIRHGNAFLGGGEKPVSIVEIENTSVKDVENKWTSYIKKNKGKVSKQGDVWFHDNAVIKSISKDTLDMWSTVRASGKSVIITLAVNSGGNFISNSGGNSKDVDRYLRDFASDTHKHHFGLELAAAKNLRKNKEKEFEQLEKSNKKLEKEIDEMKNKISDNERTIIKNNEILNKHKKDLDEHESLVKEMEKKIKNLD